MDDDVRTWLLDSDPAIRWQVLELLGAPTEEVAAERARVTTQGWGAALLAARDEDGQWAGGACFPARGRLDSNPPGHQPWTATQPAMMELYDLGLDPTTETAREMTRLVAENCRWEYDGERFFDGEVEPCINGRTVTLGAYFGADVDAVVRRLVEQDQLGDGGWNCEVERGATVSSFHSTICVVEGLLEYERADGGVPVAESRRRGEEYLLERSLLRSKRSGQVIDESWTRFSFPTRWYYDVLRGLEHFRRADVADERLEEAVELVRSKRQDDGRWLLEDTHPGVVHVRMEQDEQPSRWNTLRALRVLGWWDAATGPARTGQPV